MWDLWDTNIHGSVQTRNHIEAHSKLRNEKGGSEKHSESNRFQSRPIVQELYGAAETGLDEAMRQTT